VIPNGYGDLLSGENAPFLDEKYIQYRRDPASVEPWWRELFNSLDGDGAGLDGARLEPPGPDPRSVFRGGGGEVDPECALRAARRQSAVVQLINAWRVRGHFLAEIDPLRRRARRSHPELTLGFYGLGEEDLDVEVPTAPLFGLPETAKLRTIVAHLERTYGGFMGVEFMNIDDMDQKRWVQEQLESLHGREVLTREEELRVLRKLCDAENFERMLHTRFPGTKRFSLEGGETLVPLLDLVLTEGARRGVREVVMGMAHRGRLNVLANTLDKPVRAIAEEFQDSRGPTRGSGDVKYHLGYSADVSTADGASIHVSLTPNPSHLEVVNPVVEGRTRAKLDRFGDPSGRMAMPVLLHGDAAFIGQGSVAETLQLSELDGYRTGGTLHIIINNQIGFTTAPRDSRSTPYATDVARMMAIPIFHVNGEEPWAVAAATRIAVEWRQRFGRDVVIDMYCYRKHGHNEGDEPSFTQPLEYEDIRRRPTPREAYARRLTESGHVTAAEAAAIFEESRRTIEGEAAPPPELPPKPVDEVGFEDKPADPDAALYRRVDMVPVLAPSASGNRLPDGSPLPSHEDTKGRWIALTDGRIDEEVDTSYDLDLLVPLLRRANHIPEGFTAHAKVHRLVEQRLDMAEGRRPLDWSTAEQAAFGTLVCDGIRVRFSGQDSGRGTFSQRHAVWTDIRTGAEHTSLAHLADDQAVFQVIDSNLSELAVLGFEYGYTLDTPDGLVLWEAQFGDFANGAQVIIDQYIASSEQKWGRLSGLVMLLPHGYEGQGPEHSSARLERYLLLCAQDNIQVANCSTPASYFHLLRRQVLRHVRKPLILMTPKSLLRHAACTSTLNDLATGAFQRVIPEPRPLDPASVRRAVFCSGHVYYDLVEHYAALRDSERVAVHRVELLYPFPHREIRALIDALPEGADVVWCQEEPANMGAWPVLQGWLREVLPPGRTLRYAGRPAAASPATGSHRQHHKEQEALVASALTLSGG
jgi:2-oxoglutarate dehydrogenase E1 component